MHLFFLLFTASLALTNCASICLREVCLNPLSSAIADYNQSYVIEGDSTNVLDSAPYLVSIGVNGHQCSGAIIGAQWILTAAQCVIGLPEKLIRIRYLAEFHNFGGKIAHVDRIIMYYYDRISMTNDIALVRTTSPMEFDPNYFAKLPDTDKELDEGTYMSFVGFGIQSEESGLLSASARTAKMPLIAYTKCDPNYANMAHISLDTYKHLCVGDLQNGGKSFCNGDVGGPLLLFNTDVVYGIASFTYGCGKPGFPGIFTKVSPYRIWIDAVMAAH